MSKLFRRIPQKGFLYILISRKNYTHVIIQKPENRKKGDAARRRAASIPEKKENAVWRGSEYRFCLMKQPTRQG